MINTSILSILTNTKVDSPRSVIKQGYGGSDDSNAGCWILTSSVHSICNGTVLSVDRSPSTSAWCVTIEVDANRWVRYCGLGATNVIVGHKINKSDFIGYAYKGLMRFEYCTSKKTKFPVRLLSKQLYKTDPSQVLFGQETLSEVT